MKWESNPHRVSDNSICLWSTMSMDDQKLFVSYLAQAVNGLITMNTKLKKNLIKTQAMFDI